MGDETMEMVHDSKEEYYFLRPKTKGASPLVPKLKIKLKILLKLNSSLNLKFKPKMGWKPCYAIVSTLELSMNKKNVMQNLEKKIAVTAQSYSHNRKYPENTEYFDISSSQNMKELYITDKAGNYIEDIDEAINNSLEAIKNCYQFCKVKSFKYKITAECENKKRTKEEAKTTKTFFNTDYIINNELYENGDFTQWLNFEI